MRLEVLDLGALSIERFASLLGEEALQQARARAEEIRRRLAGRVLWNVNSTAVGGGVAEILNPLLRYTRGLGIDSRWLVIRGNPEFFRVTKRLHHALHGSPGDGTALGPEERRIYEATLRSNLHEIAMQTRPGDVVLLHDPQTAGLAPELLRAGVKVIWRCHIGCDGRGEETDRGWDFLRPYLADVPVCIFSRRAFVPESLGSDRCAIVRPSIDPFSAKNCALDETTIRTALVHTGLVEGPLPRDAHGEFTRTDGSPGRLEHMADVVGMGRLPSWETPLVVQVSRWDPLKDPIGVMKGFADMVDGSAPAGAQLLLAGPNVSAVADDPEGARAYEETIRAWRKLPHTVRHLVHLACLPMADPEENAIIVNALQRHAAVVVQKSLREGFGLTVTEAMWKGRPVLASAVGGIQDQIEDGVSGVLLEDPASTQEFAAKLRSLLENPVQRTRLGDAARERVREHFLGLRHLLEYANVIERVDELGPAPRHGAGHGCDSAPPGA